VENPGKKRIAVRSAVARFRCSRRTRIVTAATKPLTKKLRTSNRFSSSEFAQARVGVVPAGNPRPESYIG
jgi:hypothetical protein